MAIVKGDKVRFLNDIGGGVVTRIVGSVAYVEDEDGFEIPAQITQIVLVEKKEKPAAATSSAPAADQIKKSAKTTAKESAPSVSLVFLPGDKPGSQSGDYRLHLVNDTDYQVVYAVCSNARLAEQWELMYQGVAEPFTQPQLDKVPGRILDEKELRIQLMFFKKDSSFSWMEPVQTKTKLKLARLMRDGAFVANNYFSEKAYFISLLKTDVDEKLDELKLMAQKLETLAPKSEPAKKSPQKKEILEIDLHIHEIMENSKGLSNGEMLTIQLNKFQQVLEDYKNTKGQKIVFIHGVGNGVLKQEIVKLLKSKYKHLYYQDASFKEYGYGATMIII